jgi:hypothetical protein
MGDMSGNVNVNPQAAQAAAPLPTSTTPTGGSAAPSAAGTAIAQQAPQSVAQNQGGPTGSSQALMQSAPVDTQTQIALNNSAGSIQQAVPTANNLVQNGTLGRLDATQINSAPSTNMQDVIAQRQKALNGMDAMQQNAITSQGTLANNQTTQTAQRQLQSSQNASGVRGATASAQQLQAIMGGAQANANVQRDVYLANQTYKQNALNSYEASVTSADSSTFAKQQAQIQLQQYNLSQAAKEQSAQLSTALGIASMASGTVASQNAANSAVAAGQAAGQSNSGGGLLPGVSIICEYLYKGAHLTPEEYKTTQLVGFKNILNRAEMMVGYYLWAVPLLNLANKVPAIALLVKKVFTPMSQVIAGTSESIPAKLLLSVVMKLSTLIGKVYLWILKKASAAN